jgi:hypothetical protein
MPSANMSFLDAPSTTMPPPPSLPTRIQTIDELVQRRAATAKRAADVPPAKAEPSVLDMTASRDPKVIARGMLSRFRSDWRSASMRIKVCGAVLPALAVFVLSSPSGASVQPQAQMVDEAPSAAVAAQDAPAAAPSARAPQGTPVPGNLEARPGEAVAMPPGSAQTPPHAGTQGAPAPMPQVFVPNAGLPQPVTIEEVALRRQAMDALFAGDFPRAMALYQSLAAARPDVPQYAATARVLAAKTRGH